MNKTITYLLKELLSTFQLAVRTVNSQPSGRTSERPICQKCLMAKQQIKFRSQQSITYLPEGYIHLTLYAGVQQKRLPALLELHRKWDIFGEGPEWIVVP